EFRYHNGFLREHIVTGKGEKGFIKSTLYFLYNIMNLNEHTHGINFSSEHQSPNKTMGIVECDLIWSVYSACMFFLCRNRLESNTEHWNALLLSLRELIEWVIRKDTELTGLGPVCGDVAALQKQQVGALRLSLRETIRRVKRQEKTWHCTRHQCSLSRYFCFTIYASPLQDDHRGFRRQLEDKRPVVENNLLSGRQYIANEPPLSDTSDSEENSEIPILSTSLAQTNILRRNKESRPTGRELDGDSRGYRSAEEQARELTRSIRREVNKLSEQWNALIERSDAWKRKLDDTANRFHLSERLCALEEATGPFIGEHREKTFGNELPCSKDDPQMRSRPIDARVASNATEISSSRSSPEEPFISIAMEDEEVRSRLLFFSGAQVRAVDRRGVNRAFTTLARTLVEV
ncbi:Dystrophin, isoform D, partial [Trachymyrmex zeteki]